MGATGLPFLLCYLMRGVGRSMHSTCTPPHTKLLNTDGSLHTTPNHTVLALWFDGLCTSPWVSIFWFTSGSVTSHVRVCGQFIFQLPAINTANPQQILYMLRTCLEPNLWNTQLSTSSISHGPFEIPITWARRALAKSVMYMPSFVCVRTHQLFQQDNKKQCPGASITKLFP